MKKGISITVRATTGCPFYRIDTLWDGEVGHQIANCTVLARIGDSMYACVGLQGERCPLNKGTISVHAK